MYNTENEKLKREICKYKQVLGASPFIDDSTLKGGFRVVNTIEDRNKIPCCNRKWGMEVVVVGPDLDFQRYSLRSRKCGLNNWKLVSGLQTVDETQVTLVEDYSVLGEDITTQRDLNLTLKTILTNLQDRLEIPEDFFIATTINNDKLTYKTDIYREINLATILGSPVLNSNEIIRVGNDFYLTINYATDGTTNQEVVKLADCYIKDNILIVSSFIKKSTPLSSVHALVYNETDEFLYIAERKYSDTQAGKICKVDSKTLNVIKVSNFPNIPLFGQSTTDIKIFNNKLYIFGGYGLLARLVEVSTNLEDYEELYVGTTSERRTHMSDQPFVIYNGKAYISCYDNYVAEDRFKHVKIVEVDLLTKEVRVSGKISVNSDANNTVGTHWMTVYGDKLIFTAYSYGATVYHSSLVRVDIKTLTKEDEKYIGFPVTDDNSIVDGYIYLNGETFGFETWIDQYPNYPIDNAQLVKINPFDFTDFNVEMNPYNSGYGSYGSINHNPNYQQVELKTLRNTLNTKLDKPTANGVWSVSKVGSVISYVPVSAEVVETDTLATVMNRGNYAPKEFEFKDKDGDSHYFGYDASTYNMYFGNYRPSTVAKGSDNMLFGWGSGVDLISGNKNSAFGNAALWKLTTGSDNVAIGSESGRELTTGSRNVTVGSFAGYIAKTSSDNVTIGYASGGRQYEDQTGGQNVTVGSDSANFLASGSGNISIGYRSANALRSGSKNVIIGYQTGDLTTGTPPPSASWDIGNNNVFIGTLAGVVGQVSNKNHYDLIIHSDNGVDRNNPLIRGNFASRFLKISGAFSINPSYMPEADAAYTKNIVAKPDGTFGWEDKVVASTPNLEAVVQVGNGTTKNIVFQPDQGIAGQIGFSKTTYSYYFGNMNPAHTGAYNVAMGYNALSKVTSGEGNTSYGFNTLTNLTTGVQNTVLGTSSGLATTTGTYNTFVGSAAAVANTTGFKNTILGTSAGSVNTTGVGNTYVGFSSGANNISGNLNVTLGTYAGQGVTGSNNVLLGVGSGMNGGAMSNKLVIHNNTTLTGLGPTLPANGTFGNINQGNLANALITGDFAELWVKLNGTLSVAPSKLVNNDPTYTKNLVAKVDGTFGWEDKVNTSNIYSTTETKTNGIWIDGKVIYRKFVTITIAANAVTDNPFSNVIAGASEIISFEKCFMKIDTGTIKFAPGRLESNATSWEYDIRNDNDLSIIMRVASTLPRVISGVVEYTKPVV